MVLYLRLFDNSIHGWDLARAIGMGEPLDDETVEVLWAVSVPQREAIRASGHFGSAEIQVPEDARSRRGCSDCSAAKRDGAADWVTRLGYPPAGRSKVARLARRD